MILHVMENLMAAPGIIVTLPPPSFENGGTDRAPRTADPLARLPVCPLAESDCLQLAPLQRVSGASRHLTLSPQRAPTALC